MMENPCPKILLTAATEAEMPKKAYAGAARLICGVGPAAAAFRLCRYLERNRGTRLVIMAGIGGAYQGSGLDTGDVAAAEAEIFLDLARCSFKAVTPLEIPGDQMETRFDLSGTLELILSGGLDRRLGIKRAVFGTVCCSSADPARARAVSSRAGAAVENMEGAAAAMVCREYGVDFFELRAVSNLAGEPDRSRWQVAEALEALGAALDGIMSSSKKEASLLRRE